MAEAGSRHAKKVWWGGSRAESVARRTGRMGRCTNDERCTCFAPRLQSAFCEPVDPRFHLSFPPEMVCKHRQAYRNGHILPRSNVDDVSVL